MPAVRDAYGAADVCGCECPASGSLFIAAGAWALRMHGEIQIFIVHSVGMRHNPAECTYPEGMADIYAFPSGSPNAARLTGEDLQRPEGVPDAMWEAVRSVRAMKRVRDVRYREIPIPATLADYGVGVELEAGERDAEQPFAMSDAQEHIATGWIMVLYSKATRADWGSRWRCVAFARLLLEASENDSLTPGMYWEDMCGFLGDVGPDSVSGTVTVTQNTAFGSMTGTTSAGCEIRVSWTPLDDSGPDATMDAGSQIRSWAAFIASTIRYEEDDVR